MKLILKLKWGPKTPAVTAYGHRCGERQQNENLQDSNFKYQSFKYMNMFYLCLHSCTIKNTVIYWHKSIISKSAEVFSASRCTWLLFCSHEADGLPLRFGPPGAGSVSNGIGPPLQPLGSSLRVPFLWHRWRSGPSSAGRLGAHHRLPGPRCSSVHQRSFHMMTALLDLSSSMAAWASFWTRCCRTSMSHCWLRTLWLSRDSACSSQPPLLQRP